MLMKNSQKLDSKDELEILYFTGIKKDKRITRF